MPFFWPGFWANDLTLIQNIIFIWSFLELSVPKSQLQNLLWLSPIENRIFIKSCFDHFKIISLMLSSREYKNLKPVLKIFWFDKFLVTPGVFFITGAFVTTFDSKIFDSTIQKSNTMLKFCIKLRIARKIRQII